MTDNIINIGDKKKGSQVRTVRQIIQEALDDTSEGGAYQNANKAIIILIDSTDPENEKTSVATSGVNVVETLGELELAKSMMLQTWE